MRFGCGSVNTLSANYSFQPERAQQPIAGASLARQEVRNIAGGQSVSHCPCASRTFSRPTSQQRPNIIIRHQKNIANAMIATVSPSHSRQGQP
jgi:hypothetical protein